MGYTTYFNGEFSFNREIDEETKIFVNRFSRVRHMKRNPEKIKEIFPDWEKNCLNGNLGIEGEFFVGGDALEPFGQKEDESVMDGNRPASTQPGLWCQWEISENGTLKWDEGEKFYYYVEWLEYLIKNIFIPKDYILNGEISWEGEDSDDFGTIVVVNNEVTTKEGIRIIDLAEIETDDLIEELNKRGYECQQIAG